MDMDTNKVIKKNGMALVYKIHKDKQIKTCKDFADTFIQQLRNDTLAYDEVRLIFDCYAKTSLKNKTHEKRTGGVNIRYIIEDNTNIESIAFKKFLSNIQTKHDLTIYLANYAKQTFESSNKKYVIVYETKSESNLENYDSNLLTHCQEEEDTLMILCTIDVSKQNPFAELIISSPDTDVLVLLIYFYKKLCN